LLETKGVPREEGPIRVMFHEHQLGRGYIKAMVETLENLNKDVEAKTKFINNALSYISLLRDHISKEGNILYRIALEIMSESDDSKLLRGFKDIEMNRLGPEVHEQLIKSLDIIESLLKSSKN
jgi:hemerythrin-like domain-containing protein